MDKANFAKNRNKYYNCIGDRSLSIFFAGKAPVKQGDEFYEFSPDRNFYYLTGIDSENIVAILDIESLEKRKKLEEVLQNLKISDNIIDVSEENKKSLIILKKNELVLGYITNISSTTIAKRASK